MEGRPSRGRGGQWRRGGSAGGGSAGGGSAGGGSAGGGSAGGGSAGGDDCGASGDRRGRGRGGHHRGRGKRDHYRGRGRGFPEAAAGGFSRRGQDEQDDKENAEDQMPAIYSRRKLESNWVRYEESEKEEVNDDVPEQRGTDYHILLTSAGDSYTQFRFSEEKDWEVDSLGTNQVPALFVDLEALARTLQELPLHQRLDLEPSLVQETTPVDLPSITVLNKVGAVCSGFKPPAPGLSGHGPGSCGSRPVQPVRGPNVSPRTSIAVISPEDDSEKELEQLLGLQKPDICLSLAESITSNSVETEPVSSGEAAPLVEEMEQQVIEEDLAKTEKETKLNQQKPEELQQKSELSESKQEMTEEDLEDWLDSMIS